jgi:homeobox-leucine zipper protein
MSQVISLTEKLQDKETSPSSATITTAAQEVDQPDEHTEAASTTGFATVDGALAAPPPGHQQPPHKDDLVSSGGTNDDGDGGAAVVVFDVTEGANDRLSCESAYFADAAEAYERDCAGHYALSSEEEDGGAVSDEGCSFDLPDAAAAAAAMFGAAGVVHHDAADDEEAQLGSWTAWFWS